MASTPIRMNVGKTARPAIPARSSAKATKISIAKPIFSDNRASIPSATERTLDHLWLSASNETVGRFHK